MTATHTTAEPLTGETYLRMHPDAIDIGRNARISNILPLDPEFLESVRNARRHHPGHCHPTR